MSKKKQKQPPAIEAVAASGRPASRLVFRAVSQNPQLRAVSAGLFSAYIRQALVGLVVSDSEVVTVTMYGLPEQFVVSVPLETAVEAMSLNEGKLMITKETEIVYEAPVADRAEEKQQEEANTGRDFFGYEDVVGKLEKIVELSLHRRNLYSTLRLSPPKGLLLYGPPGVGKTLLLSHLSSLPGLTAYSLGSSGLFSKFLGETETRLSDLFAEAKANTPSLLIIDDLDSVFPARESSVIPTQGVEEYHRRALSSLLSEFDGISTEAVLVVAATSRLQQIDPSLRRPGRFDKEVEITVPSAAGRRAILAGMLQGCGSITAEDITALVSETHGFVGADLSALCREAGENAISRALSSSSEPSITLPDLTHALSFISPSALKDVVIEVPKVYWTDIGGYESVKTQVQQAVLWPLQYPDDFRRLAVRPPRGVLLYGPPGCCKTMMAKAVATESAMNFIAIKGPELFSKYVGDTEKAIREIFRRARTSAPCVVFVDELDSMATKREGSDVGVNERVLCTLLNELDGVEALNDVLVLAATNRPELIDKALIRPGRFDRLIYVSPPDSSAREQILRITSRGMPLSSDIDLHAIAARLEGYSGAEVSLVPREAGILALTEDIHIAAVEPRHFEAAIVKVRPRISRETVEFYERFERATGRSDIS